MFYNSPISINTTTAVRARGYEDGKPPSDIITNTYFINEDINLSIISLVTDPDNLFSDERGIYVKGTNGRDGYCDNVISNLKQDWERTINIELYETNGELGF